jgi:hypothetical protein
VTTRADITDADRKGLEGIYGLSYRGEKFTRSTARKSTTCWRCDNPIEPGEATWAPMGNGMNRYRRLHGDCGLAEVLEQVSTPRLSLRPAFTGAGAPSFKPARHGKRAP